MNTHSVTAKRFSTNAPGNPKVCSPVLLGNHFCRLAELCYSLQLVKQPVDQRDIRREGHEDVYDHMIEMSFGSEAVV